MQIMKNSSTKRIIELALILVALWVIVITGILMTAMTPDMGLGRSLLFSLAIFTPLIPLFFVNYYLLCPYLFFTEGRRPWFFIINALVIFGWRLCRVFIFPIGQEEITASLAQYTDNLEYALSYIRCGTAFYHIVIVLVQHLLVAAALALCNIVRNLDIREALEAQKRNAAEAELSWLKSQLNPHFLFNTLNNISSLAAIDPDKTQESIAQLSDLLRYVLYESNKDKVRLAAEISFMRDYIALMKLRCNALTKVEVDIDIPSSETLIAPLLFIALVENAFKHGVNARKESFVRIRMGCDCGNDLVFSCENSLHEKPSADFAGSGIGIRNMQKRLELIYPGRYQFQYGVEGRSYVATLIIRELFKPGPADTDLKSISGE